MGVHQIQQIDFLPGMKLELPGKNSIFPMKVLGGLSHLSLVLSFHVLTKVPKKELSRQIVWVELPTKLKKKKSSVLHFWPRCLLNLDKMRSLPSSFGDER